MTEHSEQANFVEYILYSFGGRTDFIRPLFFSVPNGAWLAGGRNRWAVANKLKAEGLTPGVADILYLQPRGRYHFLAIEMKSPRGRISPEQEAFLIAVAQVGGLGVICYSSTEAITAFEVYMELERHDIRLPTLR